MFNKIFAGKKKRPAQSWRGKPWDGWFEFKYPGGALKEEGEYLNAGRNGPWVGYHQNGTKEWEGKYLKDVKIEVWKFYDEEGKLVRKVDYLDGQTGQE